MRIRTSYRWEAFKAILAQMFQYFCVITTIIIVLNGVTALRSEDGLVLDGIGILRFPMFAFIAVLPMLMFVFFESRTTRGSVIIQSVHFALTAAFVILAMLVFGVPDRDAFIRSGIMMLLFFGAAVLRANIRSRRYAAEINKQLETMHREENATHTDENATHHD